MNCCSYLIRASNYYIVSEESDVVGYWENVLDEVFNKNVKKVRRECASLGYTVGWLRNEVAESRFVVGKQKVEELGFLRVEDFLVQNASEQYSAIYEVVGAGEVYK